MADATLTRFATIPSILLTIINFHFLTSTTQSQSGNTTLRTLDCIPIAVQGLDVVYYFQSNNSECQARSGNPSYYYNLESSDHNGDMRTYQFWFSSQENLDLFSSNPWYYAPKYGGFCSIGTCCELKENDWPWNAWHLGPPAGPDSDACGFRVYNNSLYFNIGSSYDKAFFGSNVVNENINNADTRWIGWFGNLHSGIFNFDCFSTMGWGFQHCIDIGQVYAPLASDVEMYGYQACRNASAYSATIDIDSSGSNSSSGSTSSEEESGEGKDEDAVTVSRNVVGWFMVVVFSVVVIGVIVACVKYEWWKKSEVGRIVANKIELRRVAKNKDKFVQLQERKDIDEERDNDSVNDVELENDMLDKDKENVDPESDPNIVDLVL